MNKVQDYVNTIDFSSLVFLEYTCNLVLPTLFCQHLKDYVHKVHAITNRACYSEGVFRDLQP